MQLKYSAVDTLALSHRAAEKMPCRKSPRETDEMIREMSLTVEANIPAILRHNANNLGRISPDDAAATTLTLTAERIAEATAAMLTATGNRGETPTGGALVCAVIGYDPTAVLQAFARAVKAGNALIVRCDDAAFETTTFIVNLMRRRLQQLGWEGNIVMLMPDDYDSTAVLEAEIASGRLRLQ